MTSISMPRTKLFSRVLPTVSAALAVVGVISGAQASVEITSNPTKHMLCGDGVCSPTDKKANLNVDDLANMLATSDVKVTTGNGAVTITVGSAFTWTSANRLTLDANLNVSFRAAVEVAGQGGLTIITNDGGTGGDILFFEGGVVDFWDTNSSLIVNGQSFTLVGSLPDLVDAAKANPAGYYALSKNYNAFKTRVYKASPIKKFSGIFEGLGHTISNLAINYVDTKKHPPPTGLFSISSGTLRDIGLIKESVASLTSAGGLAGENDGTISQSYLTGSETSSSSVYGGVGSLVGLNFGTISKCWSSSKTIGTFVYPDPGVYGVGDLVGVNSGGTIVESYANGVAENDGSPWGGGYMGGLVGVNENNGTITGSYFTGTITNNEYGTIAAGGLVGLNQGGTIYLSFSNSIVSGSVGVAGGLVGLNQYYQSNPGVISQSFASGAVTAHNAGGLAGVNGGKILNSYASGAANGGYAGGLVGTNGAVISLSYSTGAATGYYGGLEGYGQQGELNDHSYWDTDTSGITDLSKGAGNIPYDPGITGLTSVQLGGGLPPGFDPNVWSENATINNGLPYLLANPPQ